MIRYPFVVLVFYTLVTYQSFGDLGHELFGHINYHNFESKSYNWLLNDKEERNTHYKMKDHIKHQVHTMEFIERVDRM